MPVRSQSPGMRRAIEGASSDWSCRDRLPNFFIQQWRRGPDSRRGRSRRGGRCRLATGMPFGWNPGAAGSVRPEVGGPRRDRGPSGAGCSRRGTDRCVAIHSPVARRRSPLSHVANHVEETFVVRRSRCRRPTRSKRGTAALRSARSRSPDPKWVTLLSFQRKAVKRRLR
jgi:hypothetical protein